MDGAGRFGCGSTENCGDPPPGRSPSESATRAASGELPAAREVRRLNTPRLKEVRGIERNEKRVVGFVYYERRTI